MRIMSMLHATHIDLDRMLANVSCTCREMLHDRGCATVDTCDDPDELMRRMEGMERVIHGSGGRSIEVFFMLEERVSVKNIRIIMEASTADTTIFVSTDGPTSFARKEAHTQWGYGIQFFRFVDLCMNITKHVLVPPHSLHVGERKHKDAHYPRMLVSDPICQYYNFRVGDLIRIQRKHGCVQSFDYFRLVVSV